MKIYNNISNSKPKYFSSMDFKLELIYKYNIFLEMKYLYLSKNNNRLLSNYTNLQNDIKIFTNSTINEFKTLKNNTVNNYQQLQTDFNNLSSKYKTLSNNYFILQKNIKKENNILENNHVNINIINKKKIIPLQQFHLNHLTRI